MNKIISRRAITITLFVLALLSWVAEFFYIIAAWKDTNLPVSWSIFGAFHALILLFLVPALILAMPKDPLNPRRVIISTWLIFVSTTWSFYFLYTYLTTYVTDRFAFLMLITNHGWEVPIFSLSYSLFIYWRFCKMTRSDINNVSFVRFPVWASFGFIALISFAAFVGVTMARIKFHVPLYELAKTVIGTMAVALMSGILCFFIISHIIKPWLEKLPRKSPLLSLRAKLGIILASMTIFAFSIYVPIVYQQGQYIIGKHLTAQSTVLLQNFRQQNPDIAAPDQFTALSRSYTLGLRGYIIAIDKNGNTLTTHPRGINRISDEDLEPQVLNKILAGYAGTLITHRGWKGLRYITTLPYQNFVLVSFIYEADFLNELRPLIFNSIIVSIVFGGMFTVLIILFVKGLTGPIHRLILAAREVVEHRRPMPIITRTGDEIEILSDEFTEMARQIFEYEQGLEQKIAERTVELSRVNEELREKSAVLEHVLEDVKKVDDELARLNRAKTEFISMASHQLRTPLTAIKWYGKILSNSGIFKLTPTQLRAYHQIVSANERMIELVNALLNVSRIEMGTLAIEPREIEVGKIIENALRDIWPMTIERGVKLIAGPFPKITAILDPKFLEIIVSNLASNAVRYTTKEGEVKVDLAISGRYVTIKVSDTGLGIPANEQKQIFSKFFRASNIISKEPQGTGLGLYIAKSVVEMLGGKISFVSQENKGTVFTVSLPRTGLHPRPGAKELIPINLS